MYIHTVWIQRKQRYPDEYLPELVAAIIDENGHNDNPGYIHRELEKHQAHSDIISVEYVLLNLPNLPWEKIQEILSRDPITVHSEVEVYPV